MKNLLKRLVFALPVVWTPALRAEAPPLFEPEPPEPAAAALVEAYLPLLAAGQFEQALALNDLRGMRQYLLERRLADLKTKNPELAAQELDEMSAQMQLNELAPDRLRAILLDVMQKAAYAGMTWRIQGFAPAPEGAPGYLASVAARTPEGKEKPILLGIKKLGDQWLVAPEIVEELGRKMVVPGVQTLPPPEPVAALVDDFWKRWQTGELDAAYGMFGQEYRQRVPQLAFLQQAQEFIARIGVPTAWTIVQCRRLAPDALGLGVNVQGSTALKPTIMLFRKIGETWTLQDAQFQMPNPAAPPAAAPATPASPFRSDLRPDLKAVPAPAPTTSVPAEPPTASGAPAPAKPEAPMGPAAAQ